MSQVSMAMRKDYYRKNVSPIIEKMMADIIKDMPEDVVKYTNNIDIFHEKLG